jgi:hypothetical protein
VRSFKRTKKKGRKNKRGEEVRKRAKQLMSKKDEGQKMVIKKSRNPYPIERN